MNNKRIQRGKIHVQIKSISALTLFSLLSTITSLANEETVQSTHFPSKLVADERGILRLDAGSDGKSALTLAEELSLTIEAGYLVITVMTNDQYEDQAIAHGLKLKAWFEKQISTREYVPLVVHKNTKGVGYIFNMWGFPYVDDEHAKLPHGVMTVQDSIKVLDHARLVHIARLRIKSKEDIDALAAKGKSH